MEKRSHISGLIVKYLKNSLTDQEQYELNEWCNSSEQNRLLFNRLTNEEYLCGRLKELHSIDEAEQWKKIVRMSAAEKSKAGGWGKYAVAASILFIVIAGGLLLYLQNSWQATGDLMAAHQPFSGYDENYATLILADGQQVVLDGAAGKRIPVQGNTRIEDLPAVLKYQVAGTPAFSETTPYTNKLITPRGVQYQVILPDRSRVWLNAGSSISYPVAFTGRERKVSITGEAYFEVAHDADRPFRVAVHSGKGTGSGEQQAEVAVLGTHFNINAYTEEGVIKASLAEGSIAFRAVNGGSSVAGLLPPVILQPGEQVQLAAGAGMQKTAIAIDKVASWRNGVFEFNNAPVKSVMNWIARWYKVEVMCPDDILQHISVTFLKDQPLQQVLETLQLTYSGVQFNRTGNKVIVSRK